jgi:hypothetical protein
MLRRREIRDDVFEYDNEYGNKRGRARRPDHEHKRRERKSE